MCRYISVHSQFIISFLLFLDKEIEIQGDEINYSHNPEVKELELKIQIHLPLKMLLF